MKCFLKKKILYPIIGALTFVFSFIVFFVNSPNAYAADLKTVVLKSTDFTGEGEGSDNPWTLSNSSWALSNLVFYNYWNKDEISKTEAGQGSAFSSSITYNNPSKYAILSVKVYGAGQNHSNTVNVSVTCGSETTATQTVTKDGTDLTFNLSKNPTSSVVVNFQHPAHTDTAKIELVGTDKGNVTFIEITAKEVNEVSISSGTGVKSVYLSTNQNATSGSPSGTKFDKGTTVYGFAELAKGYKAKSGWTKVSGTADTEGAKYRVKSVSAGSSNFGSITADLITYNITYNLNGGTHGSTHPTTYNVNSNTFTISNPTKTGYTFKGWSGTGLTGDTNKNVSVAKGSIGKREYTANWTANAYTVTLNKQDGTGGTNSVTATYASAMPTITSLPTKQYYDFTGYYDSTTNGTKYYNADGTSARTWNKASNTTLYAQWKINSDGVIALINEIGDVKYTPESKALIDAANEAYDSLDSAQKLLVTNYDTLVQANTDYDNVDESVAKVNAIGEVVYTPECKALIDDARETYDALSNYQKSIYPEDILQKLIDAEKIYEAMNRINAIKNVENTDDYRELVDDARDYYDALDANQQEKVLNYKDLTDREKVVAFMDLVNEIGESEDTEEFREKVSTARDYYDDKLKLDQIALIPDEVMKELVDDEAAIIVMDLINDIGDVEYNADSKDLIDIANEAYEDLTEDQKALVANYQELLDDNEDYDKVDESVAKVNAIGDVEYTPECKALIDDARETYDALSEYQKSIYPEDILKKLIDAEKAYEAMDKINAIGEIENTKDCKNKILDARETYDNLTEDQKALVFEEFVLELIDDEKAFDVIDKINDIGNPKYTTDCKDKIDLARETYDNLTEDQKALVVNYETLTKDEVDYAKVDKVVKEINNIGDITYDENSNKKIVDARSSFDGLTDDQDDFFPTEVKQALINYEVTYVVLEKIYSIGDVEYTHESDERVNDAKDAFDSLTPDQKKLISENDLGILNTSVDTHEKINRNFDWLLIILLSLSSLTLAYGFGYLVSLFTNNKKRTGVKTMSVAPFGLLILTSHFTDPIFIALYIIAAAAVFMLLIIGLVLFIKKNKK